MTRSGYAIQTLQRGLDVLSLFTRERSELTLTDITNLTGFHKTTTFRIISTLNESGYLDRDPETKRYRPGLKVLQLGFAALSSLDLRQVARPHLERLSNRTGETVSFSVLDGMEIVYIDRIRNRQIFGVVLGLGSRLPAHCASMGKVMLAHLPPDELARRLQGADLAPCTSKTLVDRRAFMADLELIQARGYAVNNEELALGLRAVAAPIRGEDGRVLGAINISGSSETVSLERIEHELAVELLRTAGHVSQALGHNGGVGTGN